MVQNVGILAWRLNVHGLILTGGPPKSKRWRHKCWYHVEDERTISFQSSLVAVFLELPFLPSLLCQATVGLSSWTWENSVTHSVKLLIFDTTCCSCCFYHSVRNIIQPPSPSPSLTLSAVAIDNVENVRPCASYMYALLICQHFA